MTSRMKNHTATAAAPIRPATRPRLNRVAGRCIGSPCAACIAVPEDAPDARVVRRAPPRLLSAAGCTGTRRKRLRGLQVLPQGRQRAGNQAAQLVVLDLPLRLFEHANCLVVSFHHRVGERRIKSGATQGGELETRVLPHLATSLLAGRVVTLR